MPGTSTRPLPARVLPDLHCAFAIAQTTDEYILLVDLVNLEENAGCKSLTNDVEAVVPFINAIHVGGIGTRALYYRDSDGRFDEILTDNGHFAGFTAVLDNELILALEHGAAWIKSATDLS